MKNIFIYLIRLYKKYISPYKSTKCPYYPSCSDYAIQAYTKYGVLKGTCLTSWRLLRCNPFSKGGFDPLK